jgi:NAD(P)-dependent dehydrogenase (short-subunit alcohol dehydrogenase family)
MIKILITGGNGDWATSFKEKFDDRFDITTISRKELDVKSVNSVTSFFEVNKFDVIINNAGSIHPERVLDSDDFAWINDVNVNLIGTFLVSKHALLVNKNAMIINISSTAGFNSYPDWSSYCASKAGVITFSKCLAKDGFKVYCLCPGAIETKFRDNLNLSNDNVMSCDHLSTYVLDIISGHYESGDILFVRKDEFILNP